MDAVEYLKVKARMTDVCGINCNECPLYERNSGLEVDCQNLESFYSEKAVEIVEKWAKEHPKKTRQSEFLKMYPNAERFPGKEVLNFYPCIMDTRESFRDEKCERYKGNCYECRKGYWNEEVDDGQI